MNGSRVILASCIACLAARVALTVLISMGGTLWSWTQLLLPAGTAGWALIALTSERRLRRERGTRAPKWASGGCEDAHRWRAWPGRDGWLYCTDCPAMMTEAREQP